MADTANTNTNAWLPALKAAFPLTIPICLGFLFLGASYGILMGTKGFSFVWPMCMSAFIFAGSMEFVTVNLLLSAFNPLAGFLLALMVNARHLFYGLSMLGKFKGLGWKRPYLIFGMCDETFAINSTAKIPAGIDRGWFYFWVTLCNQLYWVTGATLGGLIGAHLPFNTDGLDFVLTALFLVIFLDQWLDGKHRERLSAVIGVLTSLACLLIFGANDFMIPSMIAMLILFVALRPHLDVLRPAADAPEATADHAMSHAADQQKGRTDAMTMTIWQGAITIVTVVLGTMCTRFLPFLVFPESKQPPRIIEYFGQVLPYAMTGLLVVYALRNTPILTGSHGLPELIACTVIVLLHVWKRNMLLSIAGGTIVYMLLVQLVF